MTASLSADAVQLLNVAEVPCLWAVRSDHCDQRRSITVAWCGITVVERWRHRGNFAEIGCRSRWKCMFFAPTEMN